MELRIAPVIRFVTIVTALKLTVVSCVPMKYEIGYRNSIDLDAEQTEARYDQGMLSDIMNDDRVELQKAESCVADNFKYDHGQKIQRYDPCEICLCIDGEIFCWWKQCDVPTKPELSGNPAAAADMTSSRLHLTTPSSTTTTTSPPSSDLSQLPAYPGVLGGIQSGSGSSFTSTTTTTTVIPSTQTTGGLGLVAPGSTLSNSSPVLPASTAALPPQSYPDQPDDGGGTGVRILHPPPPDSIPQNILSFPQTPPIMMYRPAVAGKNATSSVAIPLLTSSSEQRNKHRSGGPLKKVNPFHGGTGKKPYRKSKSKGGGVGGGAGSYVINYGRIEGTKMVAPPMTERITSGPLGDGLAVSFDEVGGRLTVGDRNDGQEVRKQLEEDINDDDEDDDDDDDESGEDDENDDGSAEAELRGQIYGGESRSGDTDERGTGSAAGSKGGEFGGYGYGMIKEPDEDKQQHYIITSSGHVEMFDDTSMEATENAFGLNRLPPQPAELLSVAGSTTTTATTASSGSTDQPVLFGGADEVAAREPIPPLITMTTNVTQNWNYSAQQRQTDGSTSGSGGANPAPPLTPYAPLSSGGSVIDVLNSTTAMVVDGSGLDYLDDNQTELIYPAVPGLSGDTGSSRSRGKQSKTVTAAAAAAVVVPVTGASDTLTTSSSTTTGMSSRAQEKHCVVMGVSYKVGSVLKQETGNCLHCVCVAGPENDPVPRVTCTPLNCPPLILPDILDGAGF